MLRNSGSLLSLISFKCAELCDYIDTKETMLIKGITKEGLKVPIIQIKLSSNVMDGNIKVGIHNQLLVGFDMLNGNNFTSNNPMLAGAVENVLVVTRSKTRAQLTKSNITQQQIKQSSGKSMVVEANVLINNNDVAKTRDVVNDLNRIALKLVPVDKLMIDRSNDKVLVHRVDKTINPIDRSLIASSVDSMVDMMDDQTTLLMILQTAHQTILSR